MGYADALYRLASLDAAGPWKKLADGITIAALQHTWKLDDPERIGLLPDFYLLHDQRSDGPAINPATAGIGALRLYGGPPLYEFRGAQHGGLLIHAPGAIELREDRPSATAFTVRAWPKTPYSILVHGVKPAARIELNGKPAGMASPHSYLPQTASLVLRVEGSAEVKITDGQ
jgi:hypothetical protein